MNITVGQTVSYEVAKVEITNLLITKSGADKIAIIAPYKWLDADNKVIRTGNNTYSDAQLATSLGENFTAVKAVLLSLLNNGGNCNIIFKADDTVTAVKGYAGKDSNNKPKWITVSLDATQFASAIAPLTVAQLKSMVAQFTSTIFS